jgi:peroxiredoxin Q/BCP
MSSTVEMPEEGTIAPDFSGITQDGSTVSKSDFAGQKLVIYFYPRDNTPGCTEQACNLRDHWSDLQANGIAVVGVSDDPVKKHAGFAQKYELPFPLIADTERAVMGAYGTYGPKNMYGKLINGTKRTTFLIDEEGSIVKVIKRPKTGDHAAEVLRWFGLAD